jgi:hypothetical protein
MDSRARQLIVAALLCVVALGLFALSVLRAQDPPMPHVPAGANARTEDEPEPHPPGFGATDHETTRSNDE